MNVSIIEKLSKMPWNRKLWIYYNNIDDNRFFCIILNEQFKKFSSYTLFKFF